MLHVEIGRKESWQDDVTTEELHRELKEAASKLCNGGCVMGEEQSEACIQGGALVERGGSGTA